MPDEFDPFHGETGLKDDYVGTITDAYFQKDEQYDRMNLHLKVQAEDGEEVDNRYACGPDWASFDGGESVEHPKGTNKGFNNKTAYFRFIKSALDSGAESVLRERDKGTYAGRGPMNAGLWKGLRFHWTVVTESGTFKDKDTKEERAFESNKVLPDKFIGVVNTPGPTYDHPADTTTPDPAEAIRAAQAASTPASTGPVDAFTGIAPPTAAAIRALATSKPYAEWVDDVMGMTDGSTGQPLVNNASLMQALGDESFYQSLKG